MRFRHLAPAVLLAAGLTACAGAEPAALVTPPGFEPGATADCLLHQTDHPDTAFAGGPAAEPRSQLRFLAYYTAAGRKPFCDGGPATDADRAWARLYVELTGNPAGVAAELG
jgi:hypothetical protein